MTAVTTNDILEALRAAMVTPDGPDDAATVVELAAATNRSVRTVRDQLRPLVASGQAEVVKVRRLALDGRMATVVGYRMRHP